MEFLKNRKDFFKDLRLDTALNEMLCDVREFADEIDLPANFELTQPRHRVLKRNVNFDYEAREDLIEDPTLKYMTEFFVSHQIELLPWPARSPDLSPIENMWSVVTQRLTHITPPAATPDQLWQRVEAFWSAVPQEHIQSLFESMPRRVAAVISNNSGY
ncbi:transposable element Tcb1 transposase [Trichonephila clavipes]|nr:transposable element Tcb1 transposase [Trichonephila clavipes]